MGTLNDMLTFLTSTKRNLHKIIELLEKKQIEYNDNLNRIIDIRKNELNFLLESYQNNASSFPEELQKKYNIKHKEQKTIFEKNLNKLKKEKLKFKNDFNKKDINRLNYIRDIKKQNSSLDGREENLKKKVIILQDSIDKFNTRIDELNTGFGFASNFFKMKKISREKEALIEEQYTLASQIELLREKWTTAEKDYEEKTVILQEDWNNSFLDYTTIIEKIDYLMKWQISIISKAAMVETLKDIKGYERYINVDIPDKRIKRCRHCSSPNESNLYYCRICGEHFTENKDSVMDSLVEYGELNKIFEDCKEGIKLCISTIALMKGLKKGTKTFISSVSDVKKSQDQYASLSTLKITIPKKTNVLSKYIKELKSSVDNAKKTKHPLYFYNSVSPILKNITANEIEGFFKAMGDELNKTTKEQW